MIASYPMYALPGTAEAIGRLHAYLRAEMPQMPVFSVPDDPWEHWKSPELYLSQTCGLPYRAQLSKTVTLIGAADHHLQDAPPGYYHSVIIAHRDRIPDLDANEFTLAINDPLSQSGWAAPASMGFTGARRLQTGSHLMSISAVNNGLAEVAAIDAVTWRLAPLGTKSNLVEIAITPPTLALPFITAPSRDAEEIFTGLKRAIARLDHSDRERLALFDIVQLSATEYLKMPLPPPANPFQNLARR